MSEIKRVYRHTEEENKKLAEISKQLLGRVNFNMTISQLIREFKLQSKFTYLTKKDIESNRSNANDYLMEPNK